MNAGGVGRPAAGSGRKTSPICINTGALPRINRLEMEYWRSCFTGGGSHLYLEGMPVTNSKKKGVASHAERRILPPIGITYWKIRLRSVSKMRMKTQPGKSKVI